MYNDNILENSSDFFSILKWLLDDYLNDFLDEIVIFMIKWLRGRPILLSFQTELDSSQSYITIIYALLSFGEQFLALKFVTDSLYGAQDFLYYSIWSLVKNWQHIR